MAQDLTQASSVYTLRLIVLYPATGLKALQVNANRIAGKLHLSGDMAYRKSFLRKRNNTAYILHRYEYALCRWLSYAGMSPDNLVNRVAHFHRNLIFLILEKRLLKENMGWLSLLRNIHVGPRIGKGEYPFIQSSAGIPEATKQRVHNINFNDLDSLEFVLNKYPVACVLTEPVLQNIGVVLPNLA